MVKAISTEGNNAMSDETTGLTTGLKFHCNEFQQSIINDFRTEGGIDEFQGTPTLSAGNLFSNSGNDPYNDFNANNLNFNWPKYYYGNDNLLEKPDQYLDIYVDQVETPSISGHHRECSIPVHVPEEPGYGLTTIEDSLYQDYKYKKKNQVDTFLILKDGGNSTSIITLISTANPTNAEEVTQTLTELGPWLSVGAAEALIDNANEFTENQIIRIFSANPDLLRKYPVSVFVFGEQRPLSANAVNVLNHVSRQTTTRTEIEGKISHFTHLIAQTINDALEKVVLKNGGPDLNAQRMWLSRKETLKARIGIAETYMVVKDYQNAMNELQTLSMDNRLKLEEREDVMEYIRLTNMLISMYSKERYMSELHPSEIQILEQYANSSYQNTKDKARSILRFFYNYTFADDPIQIRSVCFDVPKKIIDSEWQLIVKPNPSKGKLSFTLKGNDETNTWIKSISISDIKGHEEFSSDFESNRTVVKLDFGHLPKGNYFYRLMLSNGFVKTGTILIVE